MNKIEEILAEIGLNETIDAEVRRNGLTGSGKYNQCHSNVSNLVNRFGGNRICGYIKNPFQIFVGYTHFISHSVWITPEGNLADVTAHHYPGDAKTLSMYPVAHDENRKLYLPEFLISNTSNKKEIFASYRGLTKSIQKSKKLDLVKVGDTNFLRVTFKKLAITNLALRLPELKGESWKEFLNYGGFNSPSTATGKMWLQIQNESSPNLPN